MAQLGLTFERHFAAQINLAVAVGRLPTNLTCRFSLVCVRKRWAAGSCNTQTINGAQVICKNYLTS